MIVHEAEVEDMEVDFLADDGPSWLKLPGHVLIKICQYLEPFDVLNFGRTCHHLHKLTSSWFLWTFLALSWCQGVWNYLPQKADEGPEDPKQWLLHLLRLCRDRRPPKAEVVSFENGEKWRRLQNDKFACKVSMLACTYEAMNNRKSPFVLQCIWVYDIALFERLNPRIHLDVLDLNLDSNSASELATLGKARPYDLRGHKHPQIDARNYISSKLPSVTWCKDLFSHGPKGSICPLLVCPSAHGYDLESSGVDGLITCVSYVLERHLGRACLRGQITVGAMATRIKEICWCLNGAYTRHKRKAEEKWPNCPVAHAIVSMSDEGWPDLASWQPCLEPLGLHWRQVMSQCAALLKEHGTLDAIVDMARIRWRHSLLSDIEDVIGHNGSTLVSRINLTDCDAIGGDNPHQDMAAAAFVSQSGALVTWQLLGQAYY